MTDATTAHDTTLPGPTVWNERESWIDRIPRSVAMAAIFIAFIAIWQFVHEFEIVSKIILPSPWETAQELVVVGKNLLSGGYLLSAFWVTTQEVLLGFAIAVMLGFTLGTIVGETALGERAVLPYLVAIDTMPKVAFAPLFISWLGFGISSKVALAAFIATFPVVVATAAGLHAADENARMLFRTMGAGRWQTLIKLKIPTGLPHFFTGLKIASIGVVAGAITAEFIGGGHGFGHLIRTAASQLHTPRVFALILYLSLLGLATFWTVIWIQRRFVFWHKDTTQREPVG
jgi:NitT/TauT family transport system permease protein